MVNYQNGKVYKIEHKNGEGDIYIGSTTKQYLSQRMDRHRYEYRYWKSEKVIRFISSFHIFESYGIDNCHIVLLESVNCNSKEELYTKEAYYIKMMNCVNKYIPITTKEEKQIQKKEYRDQHKEETKEYNKKYNDENKEEIKIQQKKYYQDNKKEINQQKKEKTTCECGSIFVKHNKAQHNKTKKHQNFLNGNK